MKYLVEPKDIFSMLIFAGGSSCEIHTCCNHECHGGYSCDVDFHSTANYIN